MKSRAGPEAKPRKSLKMLDLGKGAAVVLASYAMMETSNSMPSLAIHDVESWRRFFDETKISVGVETALPWIGLPSTVAHHIKALVKSIRFGLARLGARTTPRSTAIGQEFAERHLGDDAFLFSHHSIGAGEGICRFKHTYRSGYFTFDALGYAGFSQLARSPQMLDAAWALPPDAAVAFATALRRDQIEHNTSKYIQPPMSDAGPEPGYVFLALQAVGDTVIRLAPSDPKEFYRRVVEETGKAGLRCVVKRHPRCKRPDVSKFIASIADLPHVTITELSINQLLPKAERVGDQLDGRFRSSHSRPSDVNIWCERVWAAYDPDQACR